MTWRSTEPDVETGDVALPELLLAPWRRRPDAAALLDGTTGAAVPGGTLAARAGRLAGALAARGFHPGDVLAMWAPNVPPWAGVTLGAMAAGGAVTGVPPLATAEEAAAQLADTGASVVVTTPHLAETARAAAAGTEVREVVVVGEAPGATSIATLLAEDHRLADVPIDGGAVAFLPRSSGTTGAPKTVVLTHRNLVAAVRQVQRGIRYTAADTVLAVAPFAHVMGFVVTLAAPLAAGARVVTMPRFDFEAALALVAAHRVTVLIAPPPVLAALARHPAVDRHDLSSLQLIGSGGAPLGADLQEAVARRLPHAVVGQGYGLTETAVGVTMPDRARGTVPGSVGRVMPSTELRVVDPSSGRDLGPGRRGELWARGPQVMAGYLGDDDATAEILRPDGWLRTGDLGTVDADGNVFVVDRLKELIKVNAHQVAPAELEAVLLRHPAVADAAVVGRPDERTGEVPVAYVVVRDAVDPDAIRAWVAERVAPYKRLGDVRMIDAIPRTPSGKALRRRLADPVHAAS